MAWRSWPVYCPRHFPCHLISLQKKSLDGPSPDGWQYQWYETSRFADNCILETSGCVEKGSSTQALRSPQDASRFNACQPASTRSPGSRDFPHHHNSQSMRSRSDRAEASQRPNQNSAWFLSYWCMTTQAFSSRVLSVIWIFLRPFLNLNGNLARARVNSILWPRWQDDLLLLYDLPVWQFNSVAGLKPFHLASRNWLNYTIFQMLPEKANTIGSKSVHT